MRRNCYLTTKDILLLIYLSLFILFPALAQGNTNYTNIWVDSSAEVNSNCTEQDNGYLQQCPVATINQAISLINETARIINIIGSETPYIEQIVLNNFGSAPVYFSGYPSQFPTTLQCKARNSAIYIDSSIVYFENITISGCNTENITFFAIGNHVQVNCEASTIGTGETAKEWENIRNRLTMRSLAISDYVIQLQDIWISPQSLNEKLEKYQQLLVTLETKLDEIISQYYNYTYTYYTYSYSFDDDDEQQAHNESNNCEQECENGKLGNQHSGDNGEEDSNSVNNESSDHSDYSGYEDRYEQSGITDEDFEQLMYIKKIVRNHLRMSERKPLSLKTGKSMILSKEDSWKREDLGIDLYGELFGSGMKISPNFSAVIVQDGSLFLSNVTFLNNTGSIFISANTGGFELNQMVFDDVKVYDNHFSVGFGFLFLGSAVTITNSLFENNYDKQTLLVFGFSDVEIINSQFLYNKNGFGVAVLYESQLVISESLFRGNLGSPSVLQILRTLTTIQTSVFEYNLLNNSTAGFGAILNMNSNLVIDSSIFTGNVNSHCGGSAVYHSSPRNLTITNTTFTDNYSIAGNGGAILATEGMINIQSSVFNSNSATNGGAIYFNGKLFTISVSISDTEFLNNTANFGGGALGFEYVQGAVSVSGSLFQGNLAGEEGGAIRCAEDFQTLKIQNSTFTQNYAPSGGGVLVYAESEITFVNNTFSLNLATYGGGTFLTYGETVLHSQNYYEYNYALSSGGAMYMKHGKLESMGDMFSKNFANIGSGAAVYLDSKVVDTIFSGATFSTNMALAGSGGGLLISYLNNITIESCTFDSNVAVRGAAIASLGDCTYRVNSCTFQNQRSSNGAIYVGGYSISAFNNITVRNNNASSVGGGITISDHSNSLFQNCNIFDNWAATSAGGVYISNNAVSNFINSSIQNNNCSSSGGGILITDRANATFTNVSISENRALSSGGAIVASSMSLSLFCNCNITRNTANSSGGGILLLDESISTFSFTNVSYNFAPSGGGIAAKDRACTTFINSAIWQNNASSDGGGIGATVSSTINVTSSIVYGNIAGARGGGMSFSDGCKPYVLSSVISSNSALSGGGIQIFDDVFFYAENTSILENQSTMDGGGIGFIDRSSGNMTNMRFVSNNSIKGGAISLSQFASCIMNNSLITNNTAYLGGGANFLGKSTGTWIACNFTFNVAAMGGAIFTGGLSSPDFTELNIISNSAEIGGGSCFRGESYPRLSTTNFKNNTANNGGAVAVSASGNPRITRCILDSNSAHVGGGIYFTSAVDGEIFDIILFNNTARLQGGGIFIYSNSSHFSNVSFVSNSATKGGGLYLFVDPKTVISTFKGIEMRNNTATLQGGAIFILTVDSLSPASDTYNDDAGEDDFDAEFMDDLDSLLQFDIPISGALSKFDLNTTFTNFLQGDGITITPPKNQTTTTRVFFQNLVIHENSAMGGGGIYYSLYGSQNVTFDGVYILNNVAGSYGGGVFIEVDFKKPVPPYLIDQGVFINNTAEIGGGSIATNSDTSTNFPVVCSSCLYRNNTSVGYQTTEGFCSLPNLLQVSSYPSSVTLNGNQFSIIMSLKDSFNETVTGPMFASKYWVSVMIANTSACILSAGNNFVFVNSSTGEAVFQNLVLQGKNGTYCELFFNTTVLNQEIELPGIPTVTVEILLMNCDEPNQKISKSSEIDYCEEEGYLTPENTFIILILVTLFLVLLLLLCLGFIAINLKRKLKKKKKKKKTEIIDIPDLETGKPKITLHQILNDPQISTIPWEHLKINDRVGAGAGGTVYYGHWNIDGGDVVRDVALKQVLLCRPEHLKADLVHQFLLEIKLMSALKHKYVVEFLGISSPIMTSGNSESNSNPPYSNELYLVTEWMHLGSVGDVIDKKRENLPPSLRMKLLINAAKGVEFLHNKSVIHRDLKPSNLLVDEKWTCKIADFGVSTVKPALTKTMTVIGTPIYMAPEMITSRKYSESCDVYSFAIMIVEIFLGRKPYAVNGNDNNDMLQAQLLYRICNEGLRPSTSGLPPSLKQLVIECWNSSPQLRPTMSEVVQRLKRITVD